MLFWKRYANVTIEDSHRYFIDATFDKNMETEWRFNGFYGEPKTNQRMEVWNKLKGLNNRPSIPWLCACDFNEISKHDEKLGGVLRGHTQMQNFRDVIDECDFIDLRFEGPKFTWSKHFIDGHSIWERLDRGLVNSEFLLKYPASKVSYLKCMSSDHVPIFINLSGLEDPSRKKMFRFEEMWLSDSHCGETVEATWRNGEEGDILKKNKKVQQRPGVVGEKLFWECEEKVGGEKKIAS